MTIDVREGLVSLAGTVERRSEKELVEKWAAMADGVVGVESRLIYRVDDRNIRPEPPRR